MNTKELQLMANKLFPDSPDTYKLKKTFFAILNFIHKNDWTGACHATSSILYVLLKEQGLDVSLYVGEVKRGTIIFDHSWVELNNKPMDAAISSTLIDGISFSPVLNGFDLESGKPTEMEYGYISGLGFDQEIAPYINHPLGVYMDDFPGHPSGLWGLAKEIGKEIDLRLNTTKINNKYKNTQWLQKS